MPTKPSKRKRKTKVGLKPYMAEVKLGVVNVVPGLKRPTPKADPMAGWRVSDLGAQRPVFPLDNCLLGMVGKMTFFEPESHMRDCLGHPVNLSLERPITRWRRIRNWLRFYEKDTHLPQSATNLWEDFPFFRK